MIIRYVIEFYVKYINFNCSIWCNSSESRRVSLPNYIDLSVGLILSEQNGKPCYTSDLISILKSTRRDLHAGSCAPRYLFIFVRGAKEFDFRLNERAARYGGVVGDGGAPDLDKYRLN